MKYYFQLNSNNIEVSESNYEVRKRRALNKDGCCFEFKNGHECILLSGLYIVKTTIEKRNTIDLTFPEVDEYKEPEERPDWVNKALFDPNDITTHPEDCDCELCLDAHSHALDIAARI